MNLWRGCIALDGVCRLPVTLLSCGAGTIRTPAGAARAARRLLEMPPSALDSLPFKLTPEMILWFPVFLFSLTLHEFAHAWSANRFGDMTATYKGRLTLNPLAHIDPIGTVVLPLLGMVTGAPLIGWAKPVPVNELRLRHSSHTVWVSLAGPASNILLVVVSALLLKLLAASGALAAIAGSASFATAAGVIFMVLQIFIFANIALAIFNLLPIPPLDGSHVVEYLFIRRNQALWPAWEFMQKWGMLVLWLVVLAGPSRGVFARAVFGTSEAILNWAVPGLT